MVSSAADSSASPTILAEKDQVPFYIRSLSLMSCFFFVCWKNYFQAPVADSLSIVFGESPRSTSIWLAENVDLLLMWSWRTI